MIIHNNINIDHTVISFSKSNSISKDRDDNKITEYTRQQQYEYYYDTTMHHHHHHQQQQQQQQYEYTHKQA